MKATRQTSILMIIFLFFSFIGYNSSLRVKNRKSNIEITGLKVVGYSGKILVQWDDVRAADCYEIRYSKKKEGKDYQIKKLGYVNYQIEDLERNTDYYIKVRVKKDSKWSNWSKLKKVRTKTYSLTIGTYNILSSQYDNVFPNHIWKNRKSAFKDIVLRADNNPDVFGIQEGMAKGQVEDIDSMIAEDYDSFIAKNDISPRAIFWKKNKFQLIDSEESINLFDSTITGAKSKQYAISIRLKVKETGEEILFFNIHAPSNYGGNKQKERAKIAEILAGKAKRKALQVRNNEGKEVPVVIIGDFNSNPYTGPDDYPSMAKIIKDNGFKDSYEEAWDKINAHYGTHDRITTGITTTGKNKFNANKRIDYIMVYTKTGASISDYRAYIDFENESGKVLKRPIPSDHRPLRATVHF